MVWKLVVVAMRLASPSGVGHSGRAVLTFLAVLMLISLRRRSRLPSDPEPHLYDQNMDDHFS